MCELPWSDTCNLPGHPPCVPSPPSSIPAADPCRKLLTGLPKSGSARIPLVPIPTCRRVTPGTGTARRVPLGLDAASSPSALHPLWGSGVSAPTGQEGCVPWGHKAAACSGTCRALQYPFGPHQMLPSFPIPAGGTGSLVVALCGAPWPQALHVPMEGSRIRSAPIPACCSTRGHPHTRVPRC